MFCNQYIYSVLCQRVGKQAGVNTFYSRSSVNWRQNGIIWDNLSLPGVCISPVSSYCLRPTTQTCQRCYTTALLQRFLQWKMTQHILYVVGKTITRSRTWNVTCTAPCLGFISFLTRVPDQLAVPSLMFLSSAPERYIYINLCIHPCEMWRRLSRQLCCSCSILRSFMASVQWVNWFLVPHWYLGHDSVKRHVFELELFVRLVK